MLEKSAARLLPPTPASHRFFSGKAGVVSAISYNRSMLTGDILRIIEHGLQLFTAVFAAIAAVFWLWASLTKVVITPQKMRARFDGPLRLRARTPTAATSILSNYTSPRARPRTLRHQATVA